MPPVSALLSRTAGLLTRHASAAACMAYATGHTLRAMHSEDKERQEAAMVFWIVQSPLLVAEQLPLGITRLPLYYTAKLFLLFWLTLPRFAGAQRIYTRFLLPLLVRHNDAIDASLLAWRKAIQDTAEALGARGWIQLKDLTGRLAVHIATHVTNAIRSQAATKALTTARSDAKSASNDLEHHVISDPAPAEAQPAPHIEVEATPAPSTEPLLDSVRQVLEAQIQLHQPALVSLAADVLMQQMSASVRPDSNVRPEAVTLPEPSAAPQPAYTFVQTKRRSKHAVAAAAAAASLRVVLADTTPVITNVQPITQQLAPASPTKETPALPFSDVEEVD